ncbi:MAG: hypothetical protein JOZ46_12180 [Candidatus Dormibacteraeota bacterium]|nr:hypothetical protein [Candidatus Dormibacteraeota bacterium]MBV9526558.1 hypothetical protein [Candidatus Dormibacteraeota bacterium]
MALAALLAAALVGVTAASLGLPAPRSSILFFAQSIPTAEAASQAVVLLAWVVIGALAMAAFAAALHDARRATRGRSDILMPALCVLVGVLVLTLALVHRTTSAPVLCCGGSRADVQEALRLAR